MGILSWIVVGLVAGALANVIFPGRAKGGWVAAMLLGIVGAIVGGFIAGLITGGDYVNGINITTILVAVVGALILLFGYNALAKGGRTA
jgi:uncharacterized membrane protein YeaQ/YmgE (transglycosylase-associated protein family)